MTKVKEVVEKVELSNVGNTKPPQWDGKKGDSYLMWKIKFMAHATMLGLDECYNEEFENELLDREKGAFDLSNGRTESCSSSEEEQESNDAIRAFFYKCCSNKQSESCAKS